MGEASWTGTTVWVMAAVVVAMGMVRVTMMMVSAHTSQRVTVVVKPSGQPLVAVGHTNGVVLAPVGVTVTVLVSVNVLVVKPVGQMSMYDVTQTVVV